MLPNHHTARRTDEHGQAAQRPLEAEAPLTKAYGTVEVAWTGFPPARRLTLSTRAAPCAAAPRGPSSSAAGPTRGVLVGRALAPCLGSTRRAIENVADGRGRADKPGFTTGRSSGELATFRIEARRSFRSRVRLGPRTRAHRPGPSTRARTRTMAAFCSRSRAGPTTGRTVDGSGATWRTTRTGARPTSAAIIGGIREHRTLQGTGCDQRSQHLEWCAAG